MAKLVSNVYGDALFELAVEQGKEDEILAEAKEIVEILAREKELCQVMRHPKIVKEEKVQVVESVFKGRISNEMQGLLTMLVKKDHFSETESVLTYIINRIKEHKNIGTAKVTSAFPLTDDQKKQVETRLLETTKYVAVEIDYDVDASLIGGMVIRIKDRVVDSSIKTQINEISKDLSKIQLKVGECAS